MKTVNFELLQKVVPDFAYGSQAFGAEYVVFGLIFHCLHGILNFYFKQWIAYFDFFLVFCESTFM